MKNVEQTMLIPRQRSQLISAEWTHCKTQFSAGACPFQVLLHSQSAASPTCGKNITVDTLLMDAWLIVQPPFGREISSTAHLWTTGVDFKDKSKMYLVRKSFSHLFSSSSVVSGLLAAMSESFAATSSASTSSNPSCSDQSQVCYHTRSSACAQIVTPEHPK